MKKALAVLLAFCALLSLCACGVGSAAGRVEDLKAARRVDDMIAALGEEVTLESEGAILAAQEAYDALTEEQKAEVEYADYLPIYRNNLDVLKREAAYEALKAKMIGAWVDLYDPENNRIEIREDGTATISDFEYEWTLNQNMETIRFEGGSRIVLAVEEHDDLTVLHNPDLMTCMKKADYEAFAAAAIVTVTPGLSDIDEYFGAAVDLGPLTDADGKDTGARLFAFHSNAYDRGLVFFRSGDDFALDYSAGKKMHGALYEPYGAACLTDAKQLGAIKITAVNSTLTFIRADHVADLRYESETKERVITLTNGIELRCASSMNPSYKNARFNAFAYLVDPAYVF